jgi:hypothetical protein
MTAAPLAAFPLGSMTALDAMPPASEMADTAAQLVDDVRAAQHPDVDDPTAEQLDGRSGRR